MNMTLWMLGATGSVGSLVWEALYASRGVDAVAIGRRAPPLGRAHLADFSVPRFRMPEGPVNAVVCALGANYVDAADTAAFEHIDYAVPMAVAREAHRRGATRFVLLSTLGAHPLAPMLFARSKGRLQRDLAALGFASLRCIKPSFIADSRVARVPIERCALDASVWLAARSPRFHRSRVAPVSRAEVSSQLVAAALDP